MCHENTIRKIATFIIDIAMVVAIVGCLTGCSASFKRGVKDFHSEYGGGLNRTVTAYSATGEKIGEWHGKIDVEIDENRLKFDLDGKRTIFYNATVIIQED